MNRLIKSLSSESSLQRLSLLSEFKLNWHANPCHVSTVYIVCIKHAVK